MFGFASTLICTWEFILGYAFSSLHPRGMQTLTCATRGLSLSLLNGGTAGLFWNYIIVVVGFGPVYASIAELGSV